MSHVNQEMVKYSEVDGETYHTMHPVNDCTNKEIKKATYPSNLIDFEKSKNCKQNNPHLLTLLTGR